jgi:hypothetical protein
MTAAELAAKLNGCEYREEIDSATEKEAKDNRLVVMFGASDDLVEFLGAINDEVGAYEGVTVEVDKKGLIPDFDFVLGGKDKEELRDFFQRDGLGKKVEAMWDQDGYSWVFDTDIPHSVFDVMDEGQKYCRGIVFSLDDL